MVGFGSSLRMGRRSGWEAAYLDYETLKLLLSQIEAVYEEEGHHSHGNRDVFMGESDPDDRGRGGKRKARRDYRDDLFLESDSDVAFASSQSDDVHSSESSSDELEPPRLENRPLVPSQGSTKRFTLTYGHEPMSSSSEDSYNADESKCGGRVPWGSDKTAVVKNQRRKSNKSNKRFPSSHPTIGGNSDYFLGGESVENCVIEEANTSSLFNAPFQLGVSSENTSLLSQSGTAQNVPSFYSFSTGNQVMTPPKKNFPASHGYSATNMLSSNPFAPSSSFKASPMSAAPKVSAQEEERRRARRQRRKRRLAKQRKEREKKVPRHIQIAHSKARAITERFLGLLRAEVEKVTLFAQARLGELADTAGSLRFLSFEDSNEFAEFSARRNARPTSPYEHPLSDGGIHPSASSSSEEGGGGQRFFPWFDSSSDEDASQRSARPGIPNSFSPTANPGQTEQRANLASRGDYSMASSQVYSKNNLDRRFEAFEATKRQIEHFEELRRERPIFQRNDHIVGEDLLLVSAVDEADAYSAVGVELMHILKYICVNVIAVRKICRKHDRLLMNRMLGGYYHRKRTTSAQEKKTLGGLLTLTAGDIYEAHPGLIEANRFKLVGVYDLKIQQLANSRTVKVVSSCLALALSEYEVSRSRADALARLNSGSKGDMPWKISKRTEAHGVFGSLEQSAQRWVKSAKEKLGTQVEESTAFDSDDENGAGPPSTASSVSLSRLRFTVLSISALREAARFKLDPFATYLCRSFFSFTGQSVVGAGIDGCSRDTLDFLVSYSPDAALLLDTGDVYEGLKHGRWGHLSIGTVMRSALAVGLNTYPASSDASAKSVRDEELTVMNALSILPKSEGVDFSALLEGRAPSFVTSFSISRFTDFPPALLRTNRLSYFLYLTNYYIVHPTANTFVRASGASAAYSATVIGITSFSAILSTALQCYVLSGHSAKGKTSHNIRPYRRLLLFSSFMAILGNVVSVHGIRKSSVPIVVLGRFLLGFGFADVVHRQFVVNFIPPCLIVSESARLVQCQLMGIFAGLCLGSLTELIPFKLQRFGVRTVQVSNWLMAFLWLMQFFRIACRFQQPVSSRRKINRGTTDDLEHLVTIDNRSDSSGSDPAPSIFHHSGSDIRSGDGNREPERKLVPDIPLREAISLLHGPEAGGRKRRRFRRVKTFAKRIRKLLAYNVAVPVTLATVVYAIYAQEVLFTSCALITDRYFSWKGNISGLFMGSLSVLILPIDFICEQIARRYEERTIIKRSLLILGIGLLCMVNWGSVFALSKNVGNLLTETKDMRHHYYDWLLGIAQYVIGFSITFLGLKALEGGSRALLSKVSPPNLKGVVINLGTMVTLLGLMAQVIADLQILTVGLSHRLINTDIVNALVIPMLVACLVACHFVRKHFFFLM